MSLEKYVLTDDNVIHLTKKIIPRLIIMDSKMGFWKNKNNKIYFATIIKTGNNYKQMR